MIDAKQLRIDNIIEYRHPTMGWSQLSKCEAWMIADALKAPQLYRFVRLTEAIMNYLGFTKNGFEWGIKTTLSQDNLFVITQHGESFVFLCYRKPFEHVHELQNFFNIITGDELSINWKKFYNP